MSTVAAQSRVRWPWLVLMGFLVVACIALGFVVRNGESLGDAIPYVVAFTVFGAVGALILSREQRNRIGQILLWAACATGFAFSSQEIATYLVFERGIRTGPLVVATGLMGSIGWLFGILPALFLLPILFPTGRPHRPRWRFLVWVVFGALFVVILGAIFATKQITSGEDVPLIRNPLYVPSLDALGPFVDSSIPFLTLLVLAALSQVLRFRAAEGVERQQIKWFAFAVSFFAVYLVVSSSLNLGGVLEAVASGIAFTALPAAIGLSILQYRLWDLDVVVKKTVVAGSLVLLSLIVYGAAVALVPTLIEFDNPVFLFAIALGLGIAFRPAMRIGQRIADRLVYGQRATPYEVLSDFSERLGSSYATEDVLPRMAQVLGEGAGAEVARVWLASGRELRQTGVWPATAGTAAPIALDGDAVTGVPGETTVEVRDRGDLLGALSVRMPPSDPITPTKEKLVRDLAAQAGLVLRNVRLVEDLRSSRQRLVAAQDEERRRLERNIHDGAQQQLVALTVKARLARQFTERDPAKAAQLLEQIETETQTALQDLRDLARGIYPPLLADRGLVAALEAQTRKVPVAVTVSSDGIGRYSAEVEATVYFCTLEALQNVAKYAHATSTAIRLSQSNGTLWFTVADDGAGFDPAAVTAGSGLQGMADRLAAVGGTLDVGSTPGEGTTVTGNVPVG